MSGNIWKMLKKEKKGAGGERKKGGDILTAKFYWGLFEEADNLSQKPDGLPCEKPRSSEEIIK